MEDSGKENVPLDFYVQKFKREQDSNTTRTLEGDTEEIQYKGVEIITDRKSAIKYFNIDTKKFEISKATFKQWTTTMKLKDWEIKKLDGKSKILYNQKPVTIANHGCSITIIPKKDVKEKEKWEKVYSELKKSRKRCSTTKRKSNANAPIVVGMADFHIGANWMSRIHKNGSFSFDILIKRFQEAVEKINAQKSSKVHLALLGDFIEFFGSVMHYSQIFDSDIALSGTNGMRVCYELFRDHVLTKIHNLDSVYIVSGNHDRMDSDSKKESPMGSAAEMLYFQILDNFNSLNVEYDPFMIIKEIDGIEYILTHGHKGNPNLFQNLINDYSKNPSLYTVLLTGHYHHRKTKTTQRSQTLRYKDKFTTITDTLRNRSIQVASFVTGGVFAQKIGKSNSSGFSIIKSSGFNVDHYDLSLN
jgi:predicted phosphodiesterase